MSIKNWWHKFTGKTESREGARPQGYTLDEMPRPIPTQARTRTSQPPARPRRSGSSYDSASDFGGGYIGYSGSYDSTPSSIGGDCGGSSSSSSSYDSGGSSSSSCDSGGSY